MRISVSQDAKIAYPDLKVCIMDIRSSVKLSFSDILAAMKKDLEAKIRNEMKQPETLKNVIGYNSFYKKFSSKVPMEFQIKSVLDGKNIPAFNPALTAMFMAELKNVTLTAGHDLDVLGEEIIVMLADGREEYTKINTKVQQLKKNDIFASDGNSIESLDERQILIKNLQLGR